MVHINLNKDTAEIEIKMKVWALAQVVDNQTWQRAVYEKCRQLIDEEIEFRHQQINKQSVEKESNE